jgi:hypothetical protein
MGDEDKKDIKPKIESGFS